MHILPEVLPKILTRISVKLSEEQAAKLIGRLVPGVGAAIGGTIDYTFLRVAGERAIAYYHTRYMVDHGLATPDTLPPAPPDNPAFARRIVDGSLAQPQQPGVPASEYVPVPAGPEIARAKAAAAGGPARASRAADREIGQTGEEASLRAGTCRDLHRNLRHLRVRHHDRRLRRAGLSVYSVIK